MKKKSIWTETERRLTIADALATIENSPTPMAVVDYGTDWLRNGSNSRFGTRDLRHVENYGLKVVAYNRAARRAGHQLD